MQGVRGKNRFDGAFDFFEWSAKYYMTPTAIVKALNSFHFQGKTIKQVNVIGAAYLPGASVLHETIKNAGVDLRNKKYRKDGVWAYPRINEVRVPWEARACEPIQFVFEDGSTFEILPIGRGRARMAENSIPIGLTDGLNASNFDSNRYFAEAIGKKIENIDLYAESTTTQHFHQDERFNRSKYKEERTRYRFKINLGYPCSMELEQDAQSRYKIEMKGDDYDRLIPYERVKEALHETNSAFILNGSDYGGGFWIVAATLDDRDKGFFVGNYGMTIGEGDLHDYLGDLVERYFDPSIQDASRRTGVTARFDDYGCNYYSFENVRKMLADISRLITLLENDPENPEIETVCHRSFNYEPEEPRNKKLDCEEIERAIDFYKRFSRRIESMMKLPGTDIISFAGP